MTPPESEIKMDEHDDKMMDAWRRDFEAVLKRDRDSAYEVVEKWERRLMKAGLDLQPEHASLVQFDKVEIVDYACYLRRRYNEHLARSLDRALEIVEEVGLELHELQELLESRSGTEELRAKLAEIDPIYTKLVEKLAIAHQKEKEACSPST